MGACSGGIIAAMVAAHLARTGQQDRIAAATLMVTVLDQAHAGLASAVIDERTARVAEAASRARGYLDGRSLAEVFAWLRPNDLIWNYWVNNYLLGRKPPPFDILFWNADTTRMTAGLHRDFLRLGAANALVTPGGATMLGSPVDLAAVDRDTYLVAGITDHICPWQSCYRSTQLLSGRQRFVLSTSGHVAAMVNPPDNPKARYQIAKECPEDPQEWLTPAVAGLAKMHNTRKARAITAEARDMLGGNGILLDYQVMRHMVDMEAIHTFEGTETMQTLIVGRAITGIGAFT